VTGMIARLPTQPACDYDGDRAEALPTARPDHPDHDPAWPAGYETPSTGFLQVGARDYDPDLGRWLQPDPVAVGPEAQIGVLNRWAYCANDPVNASDPTGLLGLVAVIGFLSAMAFAIGFYLGMDEALTAHPTSPPLSRLENILIIMLTQVFDIPLTCIGTGLLRFVLSGAAARIALGNQIGLTAIAVLMSFITGVLVGRGLGLAIAKAPDPSESALERHAQDNLLAVAYAQGKGRFSRYTAHPSSLPRRYYAMLSGVLCA
jgi:RHS repeat-associated protein